MSNAHLPPPPRPEDWVGLTEELHRYYQEQLCNWQEQRSQWQEQRSQWQEQRSQWQEQRHEWKKNTSVAESAIALLGSE